MSTADIYLWNFFPKFTLNAPFSSWLCPCPTCPEIAGYFANFCSAVVLDPEDLEGAWKIRSLKYENKKYVKNSFIN